MPSTKKTATNSKTTPYARQIAEWKKQKPTAPRFVCSELIFSLQDDGGLLIEVNNSFEAAEFDLNEREAQELKAWLHQNL